MKDLFRTYAGKTILFIFLVICCLAAGVCVVEELVFWDADMFYTTEEAYCEQTMYDLVRSKEDDIIWNVNYEEDYGDAGRMSRYYGEGRTNLLIRYDLVTSQGTENIFSNTAQIKDPIYQSTFVTKWVDGEYTGYELIDPDQLVSEDGVQQEYCRLSLSLQEGLPVDDLFRVVSEGVRLAYRLHAVAIPLGTTAGLLAIVLFVALMCVSARRPDTEELIPGPLNRMPFDLMTVVVGGFCLLIALAVAVCADEIPSASGYLPLIVLAAAGVVVCVCLAIGWCMSLAARVKQHTLIKGTLCWKVFAFLWKSARKIIAWIRSFIMAVPFIWKALTLWTVFFIGQFLLIAEGNLYLILLSSLGIAVFLLYCIYAMFRINRKARTISEGRYGQQSDRTLFMGFREQDAYLSRINTGLSAAVEERMKSERMKTELITNVSHDIKTPLTSIINYADLIGKEETDNTAIKEYADVLHRQSEKLKRLIEDLIEASKASTGNIEINPERCDLNVIVSQVTGEYDERLKEADLTLITKVPEDPVQIMADGRRLWRVFDNLMSNVIKYAMPGTRVYISMAKQNGEAVTVIKNTSREPIDMSPEELTERFVRGDASRNTEGNGLGLSIARSLVELQGGVLSLYADGDLFKVILRFPLIDP